MNPLPTLEVTPETYQRYTRLVQMRSGLNFEKQFQHLLMSSLFERIRLTGTSGFESYYRLLSNNPAEYQILEQQLTIGETYFFRYPQQYNFLKTHILPERIEPTGLAGTDAFRIWSAACSTGEEPYSIAILLDEKWGKKAEKVKILGTDLNRNSLDYARRGVYGNFSFRTENLSFRDRYFKESEGKYHLDPKIRQRVQFQFQNLMELTESSFGKQKFNVIFCRNVSIYFQKKTVLLLLHQLYQLLEDEGYLFLGHSELWPSRELPFPLKNWGYATYQKINERITGRHEPARFSPKLSGRATPADLRLRFSEKSPRSKVPLTETGIPKKSEKEKSFLENYQNGMKAFREQDNHLARQFLLKAEAQNSSSEETLLALAFLDSEQGQTEQALERCQALIDLNPLHPEPYFLTGLVLQERQEYEGAEKRFRRCLYCDESHILAHYFLATLQERKGREDLASRSYARTFDLIDRASPNREEMPWEAAFSKQQIVEDCLAKIKWLKHWHAL
ncbi:MAG: hypothetical protein HQM13_08245 [SAR324 cluster bacterium]|nr:hypothetical protein [SAR324 cluster bacterium]